MRSGSVIWLVVGLSLVCSSALRAQEPDRESEPQTPPDVTPITLDEASESSEQGDSQENAKPQPQTMGEAFEAWMAGDYDLAFAAYERFADDATARDDASAAGWRVSAAIGMARCRRMVGRYADALQHLDEVAATGESSADWHDERARILKHVGDYDDALAHGRKALDIDPRHYAARTFVGQLLEYLGRRDEAIEAYALFDELLVRQLPSTAEGITEAGKGFYRYSQLTRHANLPKRTRHVLTEMYMTVYQRVDRHWWPARVAAADLLRNKGNLEEAAEDYEAALKINPDLPVAKTGLGLIALEGWRFEQVDEYVEAALKINPAYGPAYCLRAKSRILERKYDDATKACEAALQINPRDQEALSLAAAAARCRYDFDEVNRYVERVEKVNPRSAMLYAALGEALSGLRQYADSEAAFLRSIEYEPTDPNARAELGMMYMQWGREEKARDALEGAWKLDEFNRRAFNTLDLLEKIEAFDRKQTEHFELRYDAETDWPTAKYLASVAEEVHEDICFDYDATLAEKTILEVFPTHRDFGVRITGAPWIHTVGACTGWVIAMDSPRPDQATPGPYHYARVLRHEFVHTVTLALTHNRIAHWFTEGLAVHAEDAPRSFAWCEMLVDAIRHDRLFTLESVDWGFIRPKRPNDRTLAYAQSEWMVEYIVARFGYDALSRMLVAYDEAKPWQEVIRGVLGIEPDAFDRDFAQWAREQAAQWGLDLSPVEEPAKLRELIEADPDDAALKGRLAKALLEHGDVEETLEVAEAALEQDDANVDALRVQIVVMSELARRADSDAERRSAEDELLPKLRKFVRLAPDDALGPRLLGGIHLARKQFDEAEEWFKRLKRIQPLDPASYRALSGIYLSSDRRDEALPELLELARTTEDDARVPAAIASIFAQRERFGEARHWYYQSLYINPFEPETHRKLAEVCMRDGDTPAAIDEYEVLCKLEPHVARNFADAAAAYHKMGDAENAKRCARKAVELDSASPAKSLLGE